VAGQYQCYIYTPWGMFTSCKDQHLSEGYYILYQSHNGLLSAQVFELLDNCPQYSVTKDQTASAKANQIHV
jgi:hypothetical protein